MRYIDGMDIDLNTAMGHLGDIRSLRGCCARINHPFTPPPPTCIAHPGAILLHDYWTVYGSPPDLRFTCYAPYNSGDYNIV